MAQMANSSQVTDVPSPIVPSRTVEIALWAPLHFQAKAFAPGSAPNF